MFTLEDIIKKTNLTNQDISNVYMIGSRVYGTDNSNSDYDYFVINTKKNNEEIRNGLINLHLYSELQFQTKLNEMKIQFIEAYFSPIILKEQKKFKFNLNQNLLLKEVIKNSDETFNLFQKSILFDSQKGIKKLFHSLRIIFFVKELIENNKIINFNQCNYLLQEIKNDFYMGIDLIEKYENVRNTYLKELTNE